MSGHIFFKERWYGFDDGLYTGARLLEIVSRHADACAPLEALPQDVSTPELKLEMEEGQPFTLVRALQDHGQFLAQAGSSPSTACVPSIRTVLAGSPLNTTPVVVLRFEPRAPKHWPVSRPISAGNWLNWRQVLLCPSRTCQCNCPIAPAWKQFTAAAHDASRRGEQLDHQRAGIAPGPERPAQSPALAQASDALLAQQDSRTRAHACSTEATPTGPNNARLAHALRAGTPPAVVANAVLTERERVRHVSAADAAGRYSSVLHLGIGGSDWGPRLITRALRHGGARREVRFASNVDSHSVADAMSRLDPHDTLVIVASSPSPPPNRWRMPKSP